MISPWHPALHSMGDCPSGTNLDGAFPFLLDGFSMGPVPPSANGDVEGWLPDRFLTRDEHAITPVAISPGWLPQAPLKLSNGSLVRPAERRMRFTDAVDWLRQPSSPREEPRPYLRFVSLDSLPGLAGALPLQGALKAIGATSLQAANLLLGNGRLSSGLHFDDRDNLLLQLRGAKSVLLVPPSVLPELNFSSWEERRWVLHERRLRPPLHHGLSFAGTVRSGRPPVENHSPLEPFALSTGVEAGVDGLVSERHAAGGPAEQARQLSLIARHGLRCTLLAGSALFIPALWAHAVASTDNPAGRAEPGATTGPPVPSTAPSALNGAVNLWYTRGIESFDAAVRAAPRFPQAHMARGDALRTLGRQAEAAAAYALAARWTDPSGGLEAYRVYEATKRRGLSLVNADAGRAGGAGGEVGGKAAASTGGGDRAAVSAGGGGLAVSLAEALEALTQAAAMRPHDESARTECARGLGAVGSRQANAGRYAQAVEAFERAVELAPGDAELSRGLARSRSDLRAESLRREVRKNGGWSRELEARLRTSESKSELRA